MFATGNVVEFSEPKEAEAIDNPEPRDSKDQGVIVVFGSITEVGKMLI